jgi:hypothetical protein
MLAMANKTWLWLEKRLLWLIKISTFLTRFLLEIPNPNVANKNSGLAKALNVPPSVITKSQVNPKAKIKWVHLLLDLLQWFAFCFSVTKSLVC